MHDFKRYSRFFALGGLLISVAVVAINLVVDPYLIFGQPRIEGVNQFKTQINEHVFLMKKYHPGYGEWDTLLVGNSRIEIGLDPAHMCFQKTNSRTYNLGVPGASVERQIELALNVIYAQDIKRLLVSVDFQDFLLRPEWESPAARKESPESSSDLRFLTDGSLNTRYWRSATADRYRALYSLDSLMDSLQTVVSQSSTSPNRDVSGFNPARDFAHATSVEGPGAIFGQKMASLQERLVGDWRIRYSDGSESESFSALRHLLDVSSARGVQVTVFTNPFHEQFWTLLENMGLRGLYEEWFDTLVTMVSLHDARVALWDFSGDSPYIHESLAGDSMVRTALKWFWEPAHYRRELGDLMLNAMLAEQCGTLTEFGNKVVD